MAGVPNFLLGNGHDLAERIAHTGGPQTKVHPYTFDQAKEHLEPRLREAIDVLDELPEAACPKDWAVAAITIHPTYIAKTYYPQSLLHFMDIQAVGSKATMVEPRRTTRALPSGTIETVELFVAGPRANFRRFARALPRATSDVPWADDLRKIEDLRCFTPGERIKGIRKTEGSPLMEIVLHAPVQQDFVLAGFFRYMQSLGIVTDPSRQARVKGLCFLPVHVPYAMLPQVEKFSFLRGVRVMPRLRSFRPLLRRVPQLSAFKPKLPTEGALDPGLRVAVFDGGLPSGADLSPWVNVRDCAGVGAPVREYLDHGLAVTSALLFGTLTDARAANRPYGIVDHYRVLGGDTDTSSDLYQVLDRILEVLRQRQYDLVNLSIGPDRPVEDDDIDRWTAELDRLLAGGRTLLSIAAGNGGESDHQTELDRIQVPADAVNALSVGACDSQGSSWDRSPYSSIGPGRSPGLVKPDVVAFGGSMHEPFWVIDAQPGGFAAPTIGTSFSAPSALRLAAGVRAHYGDILTPLTIKALLIHHAAPQEGKRLELGWGRIARSVEEMVVCEDGTVTVVFQGQLVPGRYLRVPIPIPAGTLRGMVDISATFCFASDTDPEHLPNYTRSGLEPTFRPHDGRFANEDSTHPRPASFFRPADMYVTEIERRRKGHKWETVLHCGQRMRGTSLSNPVFDIHYNARERGAPSQSAMTIPYSLVVTVRAPRMPDIYNRVLARYRTRLEALQPVIEIPIRVAAR